MRLVSIDHLNENMTLGRTIYGNNGEVLLNAGTKLSVTLLEKIKLLDFKAIYVEDKFSENLEIKDVISSELRGETTRKIKTFFKSISKVDEKSTAFFAKETGLLTKNIVDQVMTNRDMMIEMIDLKNHDDYTFQHCVNVGVLSSVIGVALNFTHKEVTDLTSAALFHDIGKMFIPLSILNKPGPLTDEERAEMQKHPKLGYDFVSRYLPLSNTALNGILLHHEKCNGNGYPYGRKKNEISVYAKILAICDVYDELTSDRCYSKAALPSEAIEYIMANSDEHFDADIIKVFLKKVVPYPVGLTVELSNGMKGIVSKNSPDLLLRPQIKLFQKKNDEEQFVDLSDFEYASVIITKVLT